MAEMGPGSPEEHGGGSGSEGRGKPPKGKRKRKLGWRIVRWILAILLIVILLSACSVWLVLANVNHSAVKSRIQSLVRDQVGLEIDYDDLDISLRKGVTAKQFRIASPAPYDGHAPDFVTLTDLDVRAPLWKLAFIDPRADRVRIGSVTVNLVADETGATTLSRLFPPSPEKPGPEPEPDEPPEPSRLSKSLSDLPSIEVGDLAIDSIEVNAIELRGDSVIRRASVTGLAVGGTVHSGGDSGLSKTEIRIASPDGVPGVRVAAEELDATGEWIRRAAVVDLRVGVEGRDAETLAVSTTANLVEQDLVELVRPVEKLLDLELEVAFRPGEGETAVRLTRLSVVDGTVTAAISGELPDTDDGSLRGVARGTGAVRIDELPVAVEGASVTGAELDFSLTDLALSPAGIAGALTLTGEIGDAAFDADGQRAAVTEVAIALSGTFVGSSSGSFDLTVAADRVEAGTADPPAFVEVSELSLRIAGDGVVTGDGAKDAPPSTNVVELELAVADASAARDRVHVETLALTASGRGWIESVFTGDPVDVEARLPIALLSARAGGASIKARGTEIKATASGLRPESAAPFGVTGAAGVVAAVGSLEARSGTQRASARQLRLSADAPLSAARAEGRLELRRLRVRDGKADPMLVRGVDLSFAAEAPLDLGPGQPGTGSARASGRVAGIEVGRKSRAAFSRLELTAKKTGRSSYRADVRTTARAIAVNGRAVGETISATVTADASLTRPKVDVTVDVEGRQGPTIHAAIAGDFDRKTQRLTYEADIRAERLGPIAGPLRAFVEPARSVNLKTAVVAITASGSLGGALVARGSDLPSLAPDPLATLRGDQKLRAELGGIHYKDGDIRLDLPAAVIALSSSHGKGGAGKAVLDVTASRLAMTAGSGRLDARRFSERATVVFPRSPQLGSLTLESTTKIGSAEQTFFEGYEIADASVTTTIDVDRGRSAFIRELVVDNPRAGTRVTLSGALERTTDVGVDSGAGLAAALPGREALTLVGEAVQNLAPISKWGVADSARGTLTIPFRLESGDLVSFRMLASVNADDVTLAMSDGGFEVRDLNGVIPIVEELAMLPTGVVLLSGPSRSPLSRTRFFDVHPFLDSDDFLTASKLIVGGQELGPIAGNMRLARGTFSVDQLQFGYRSGTVTGQVRAEYRDGDPRIAMRLNITGVRPTGGDEALDANAAITFVPKTLAVDGKVQIVRISRAHLLELLDLIDPYRETINANRVRLALKVGFPKFVRLRMRDGTLDAKVDLGGVASVVRIDEIRAIPLGPLMQLYVAPYLPGAGERAVADKKKRDEEPAEEPEADDAGDSPPAVVEEDEE